MPLALSMKPIVGTFVLDLADPTGDTTVVVRQVTVGDQIELENLFADQTQVWNGTQDRAVRISRRWNFEELKRHRVWRTLLACNIVTEEGKDWFEFSIKAGEPVPGPKNRFFSAWDALPPEVAEEIYTYVLEMNPQWGGAEGES